MKPAPASALPRGFRFAAVNCGLRKPPNVDLGLILADEPAATAGVFTQNLVQAAPVVLCREHLRKAAARDARRHRQFAKCELRDRSGGAWPHPGRRRRRSRRSRGALPSRCWSARPASSACPCALSAFCKAVPALDCGCGADGFGAFEALPAPS